MTRTTCRACGGPLRIFLDLGEQPPSNALKLSATEVERKYPLRIAVCETCWLTQLDYDVPPAELFGDAYPYFSGQSKTWVRHCEDYVDMAINRFDLDGCSHVLEVGGNDGTLLKNLTGRCWATNVEPSNSCALVSRAAGVATVCAPFEDYRGSPADLIVANNVLAHTPDLHGFAAALLRTLRKSGTATIEFPHVLNLFLGLQFDTIYHEHYSYLALRPLEKLFGGYGLEVYDVEKLDTHGGSLRLYVGHKGVHEVHSHVHTLRYEEQILDKALLYDNFELRVLKVKRQFLNFIAHNAGIVAYGAAAKGNTFLNYCGAGRTRIKMVGDTTPAKIGKYLPGSGIPIVSEAQLLEANPDLVLILAWNWREEIAERLKVIRTWGGHFVTAIPTLEIW